MGTPDSNGRASHTKELSDGMLATYWTRRKTSFLTVTYPPCPGLKAEVEIPPTGFYLPEKTIADLIAAVLRQRDERLAALGITFQVFDHQEGSCVEVTSSHPLLREIEQVPSGVPMFMIHPVIHQLSDRILKSVWEMSRGNAGSNGYLATASPALSSGSSS
ncbi:MAG: hypothetical protein Q7R81_07840 [Candidatus Peregrinibacteria bacterium]|nr:hypothetical protein [Candidatus Peregrinibacteria bacterium]